MTSKRIIISADHGLAIVYFLQSELVPTLLDAGLEVVLLTDDALLEQIRSHFGRTGLTIEGLRLKQARRYFQNHHNSMQWWLDFLRRAGASNRINLEAIDSFINQVQAEAHARRRMLFPLMKGVVFAMRRSRLARQALVRSQMSYVPNLYTDLLDRHRPDLVIASTHGWRWDRYLLREARQRGVLTGAVIVGWDNPSSYGLRGSAVDWITCWSEIQKEELVLGSDWDPQRVNISGIPSYDGYFRKEWLMPRQEYFHLHQLDPQRKLISYACSFISFSPNIQNIEALARLVNSPDLAKPSQLLVRLHPNHFMDVPRFAAEREQIHALARQLPHVHVVEPVPLGGELGYYSGEDMPEKSSMMAYSDVFTTVYSTMVVEASIHERPVVSACIDSPVGWPGKYTLPLSRIGGWPTHSRFRNSGAGRETLSEEQLKSAIDLYLENPQADQDARRQFIQRECTYTDGSAGRRTADFWLSILEKQAHAH
ncbi:MAG: hypothetical protein A2W36_04050 [Chloroflexi bacterium RBG_16_58_14]|nr:MAG: hypothetical protein A2W36_04050 [Chloroflexi bacterium RBG_16_58_14]